MTLAYAPGESLAHRLDPRTKLVLQTAFAAAAFAHTTPTGLVVLTAGTAGVLVLARTPLVGTLAEFRGFLPFLVAGPLVEAARLGPPWVVPSAAVEPAMASYRVVLVVLVSAAYVRTTPVRESRAAIQHLVPGRVGVALGAGIGFVLRFLPVLQNDFGSIRAAIAARAGDRRSLHERIRLVGLTGVRRVFLRADRFALALRARCFAWNPTLPALGLSRSDLPALAVAAALVAWTVA